MDSVNSYSALGLRLAGYYTQTKNSMYESLLRITSGKKLLNPSDNVGSYIRGQNFDLKRRNYEPIKEDLQEWQTTLNVAEDSGDAVYDMLIRLKELANMSAQTSDTDTQDAYHEEYEDIVDDIENTIDNTTYNGYLLLGTSGSLASVRLDDSASPNELDITLGKVVTDANMTDLQGDDISSGGDPSTALTHIESALNDTNTYLSNVSSKQVAVDSHIAITETIMENSESARSNLMDVDDVEEMMNYTKYSIRQQATMSMIAQANTLRSSVLSLYSTG